MLVSAFVTGMCLVVGRCVPVGETRTLTVNSAGESQIANLEPPSGWLLDGLGRNTLRSGWHNNSGSGSRSTGDEVEREPPLGEKVCALGLRTLVAEQQQQQQQGHHHPPCGKSFKVDEPSSGPSLKRSRLHYSWGDQIDREEGTEYS